jgi:hypothetical protein
VSGNSSYVSKGVLVVIVVAMLIGASTPVAADTLVNGNPDITVTAPEPEVEATSSQSIRVRLTNDGEVDLGGQANFEREVTTAKNVRVRILGERIDGPIDIKSGTQTIGTFPDGESIPIEFRAEIGDAEPGTYRIPVRVEYSYTRSVSYGPFERPDRQSSSSDEIQYITLRVEDKPQFAITSRTDPRTVADDNGNLEFTTDPQIVAGDNGKIEFTLQNRGTREATDVRLQFSSSAAGVFFGQPSNPAAQTSRTTTSLAPGEQREFSVSVGATEGVSPGTYPISIVTEYENSNGITEQADPLRTSLTVESDRTFSLRNVTTDNFRVDEPEARIRATLTNEGPGTAEGVVVRIAEQQQLPVSTVSGEAAVGSLEPGESALVEFTVAIPDEAEAGSISVPFGIEYENNDGDVLQPTSPLRQRLSVGEEQDRFQVIETNTSVTPGGSAQLDVRLRYTGTDPVKNANAKVFMSDPLSSSDDGAYLGTLEPGETTTATFRVSAAGAALPKQYSSAVEVRYEEPDGDTRFTGSLSIGVPVRASDGGDIPLLSIGAIAAIAIVGGAVFTYTRR